MDGSSAFPRIAPSSVDDLPLLLPLAEVWRYLSYPEGQTPPERTEERIARELETARRWMRARGLYRVDPPEEAALIGLPPIVDAARDDPLDSRPAAVALGLVTIGPVLEEMVRHRLAADDALGALILDAIGSAAAEEAADRLCARVCAATAPSADDAEVGTFSGCRLSSGYGEWPIEAQRKVFARLPHDEIDVHLLSSMLMVPRKSISFALWLGADGRPRTDLGGCARCPNRTCRHRRA